MLFAACLHIYDQIPEIFLPEVVRHYDPRMIAEIVRGYGLGYQHQQIGRFWVENARRLLERWAGDPRKMFDGVYTYEESLDRIRNDERGGGFLGFQKKMTSMITYYLMDEGLIEPYVFPLPVDLHVMRITVATEMMRFIGYDESENVLSDESLDMARQLYYDYAVRVGVNPLRLCDAVWLLSQSLCGKQPGNITLEPDGRANRNGRQTRLVPLPLDTSDPRQQRAYDGSCAHCPVRVRCGWNVPGKVYYVQGELQRRGKRVEFPPPAQGTLIDWQSL